MTRTMLGLMLLGTLGGWACSDEKKTGDTGVVKDKGTATQDKQVASPDGSSAKKVEEYVPKDNELAGWVEDTTSAGAKAGIEAGYTTKEIEDIIDGSHDPYRDEGCSGFAKQDYKKDTFKMVLFLWDMKTAASAKKMYDKKKKEDEDNAGLTFETISGATEAGCVGIDGATVYSHAYKGHYVFKVKGTADEPSKVSLLKPDVVSFVKLVLNKLP